VFNAITGALIITLFTLIFQPYLLAVPFAVAGVLWLLKLRRFARIALILSLALVGLVAGFVLLMHATMCIYRENKQASQSIAFQMAEQGICSFKSSCGYVPISIAEIANRSITTTAQDDCSEQATYLLKHLKADRWKHPIQFEPTKEGLKLTSFGLDGKPGGLDQNADIEKLIDCDVTPTPIPKGLGD
jgi:hypothetical protein